MLDSNNGGQSGDGEEVCCVIIGQNDKVAAMFKERHLESDCESLFRYGDVRISECGGF